MHVPTLQELFDLSPAVRYAAVYQRGEVQSGLSRSLANASASETDRYEELLVNPTLLFLAGKRGDLDCGGLRHIVVAYGHFDQLVIPMIDGHVSIALERGSDVVAIASSVRVLFASE